MKREFIWISSCGLLSLLIAVSALGIHYFTNGQVRLDDTYYVFAFSPGAIFMMTFITVASFVYLFRCILNGFSQLIPNGGLLVWSFCHLLLFGLSFGFSQDMDSGGHTVYPPLDANQMSYPSQRIDYSFFIGYSILLSYLPIFWLVIFAATLIKTLFLYLSRKQSLKSR